MDRPELLAPLHDWKSLSNTNVLENADSVYFGIQGNFCTRTLANNFPMEDVDRLSDMVHDAGKKCYLATNIIMYDDELSEVRRTMEAARDASVDAVICHDIAAMMLAKEHGLPFHVSTQASVSNVLAAKFYRDAGAVRIVLARELSLEQVKAIAQSVDIPIECFVHGALCTAISGRCYLSAEIMGFDQRYSANRGKCVQPCRRSYILTADDRNELDFEPQSGLFFNAKDLCMVGHVTELLDAGVACFKIEGRMRDPLYIQEVTACYREAIDSAMEDTYTEEKIDGWLSRLRKVFNRGFSTGYYFGPPRPEDFEASRRGNVSEVEKMLVGKVTNYFAKNNVAEIELVHGHVETGQEVVFENAADFYLKECITSIQIEREPVEETPEASAVNHVVVGIKTERPVPRNANVFLLSPSKGTSQPDSATQ
jgi:putative protease